MRDRTGMSLALLGCGLALGWFATRLPGNPSSVQAGVMGGGAVGDLVAFTSETPGGQLVYMIDQKQKVISVYEFDGKKHKLKLAAVRHYAADHLLAEFNNEAPSVAEVEQLVRPR